MLFHLCCWILRALLSASMNYRLSPPWCMRSAIQLKCDYSYANFPSLASYQCNADSRLSLKKFKALSNLEVLELMMKEESLVRLKGCSFCAYYESFPHCSCSLWVSQTLDLPLAWRAGHCLSSSAWRPSSQAAVMDSWSSTSPNSARLCCVCVHVNNDWLFILSLQAGLEPCGLVLQQCSEATAGGGGFAGGVSQIPIIASTQDRVGMAVSCIYACDRQGIEGGRSSKSG